MSNMEVDINTSKAEQKLDNLEKKAANTANKTDSVLQKVNFHSDFTYMKALTIAREGYQLLNTFLETMGGTMDAATKQIIDKAFQIGSILIPLLTAQQLSGFQVVNATIGLFNVGVSMMRANAMQNATASESSYNDLNTRIQNEIPRVNNL